MALRILYTAFDLVPHPKGASTHITYFVEGLTQAGHDVTLITAGDPSLPAEGEYAGAKTIRVPWTGKAHFLRRAVEFGNAVAQHIEQEPSYDLVQCRSIWSGYRLARLKNEFGQKYKLIYEVNGLPSIELKYHYPQLAGKDIIPKCQEQELYTLQTADKIVTPSKITRLYLESLKLPADKIHVIPNGIDTSLFHPNVEPFDLDAHQITVPTANPAEEEEPEPENHDELEGDKQEQTQLIADEEKRLLYIGTYAHWQGLPTLIQALPALIADHNLKLYIMGRGRKAQFKLLVKMIRKLQLTQQVVFIQAVPHQMVPAFIQAADICIAPLAYNDRNVTQGCCPLKILEYMACGKPIVASNLPVVRELVTPYQEAILAEPNNTQALALAIKQLIEHPAYAENIGSNAAGRAAKEFSWALAQARLNRVIESLFG